MLQDFGAHAPARDQAETPPGVAVEQFSELIGRYPNLSEVELARLINLYRELSALDVALMISDKKSGPQLDRFFEDNRSKIRTPFRQYAALLAIGLSIVGVFGWAMAIGA